jgi:hypothetical protein
LTASRLSWSGTVSEVLTMEGWKHRPLDQVNLTSTFAFASALGKRDKHLSRQTRRFKHDGLTEHSNKPIHIPLHIALEL